MAPAIPTSASRLAGTVQAISCFRTSIRTITTRGINEAQRKQLTFESEVTVKPPVVMTELLGALGDSFLLRGLSTQCREQLVCLMKVKTFEPGEILIAQGDAPTSFCILTEGTVAVSCPLVGVCEVAACLLINHRIMWLRCRMPVDI